MSHAAMPFAGGAGQAVQEVPHEVKRCWPRRPPCPPGSGGTRPCRRSRTDWPCRRPRRSDRRASRRSRTTPRSRTAGCCRRGSSRWSPGRCGAGAASDAAGRVDAGGARRTRRAIDAVHRPAGGRRVVADADAVAKVQAGVAVRGRRRPRRCRSRCRCPAAVQAVQVLPHELMFVLLLTTQVELAPVPHG